MASVTSTYARAFADVVFDRNLDADKTLREVQAFSRLIASSLELREVWEAPSIPAEQKRALLDAITARDDISRSVRNFMAVLIDHRRISNGEALKVTSEFFVVAVVIARPPKVAE